MNYLAEEQTTRTQFPASVGGEIEKARAMTEVQAQVIIARQNPRDEIKAIKKIQQISKFLKFAESAIYAYPRGGTMITGPSIRAAEALANYWGNTLYGTKTISQNLNTGTSEVMAYCWDVENNVRAERTFKVAHVRETKNGNKTLTSNRDIYEKEANDSSRRLRACILGLIPKYIVDEMVDCCEQTLIGDTEKTLKERTDELITKFGELGISKDVIEKKMGVTVDKLVAKNIVSLGYIYNSIKENFAPASQFFDIPNSTQKQVTAALSKLKGKKGAVEDTVQPEPAPVEIQEYGEYEELDDYVPEENETYE